MQRNSTTPQSQSTANAIWDTEMPSLKGPNPFLVDGSHRLVRGNHLLIPETLHHHDTKDDTKPEISVLESSARASKSRLSLIDDEEMDKLLSLLRSNQFCGKIDPTAHAPYLASPQIELPKKQDRASKLSLRGLKHNRQFLQSGLNARNSLLARSSSSVSN